MKIICVVGARPNFMKVAPLQRVFDQHGSIQSKIVHTGQHYDERMSDIFFNQLELPKPDYYLGVGSGSHSVVTAKIMIAFEAIVLDEKPDLVIVVGDVNSTLACALVAKKMNVKLAHVEAGLRSGDRGMPEEINRILTDSISDFMFVTEQSGMVHLAKEGVAQEKVFFVGNVMIDSLCFYLEKASKLNILENLGIAPKAYVLMTMHRPSNVDAKQQLQAVVELIKKVSQRLTIILPLHPRTRNKLQQHDLLESLTQIENLKLLEPQGYLEFLHLMKHSALIITDSGGIQEESTFLKIPCLTIRDTTERPVTITLGTNELIPELNIKFINDRVEQLLENEQEESTIPPFWDGRSAERILNTILDLFNLSNETEPTPNTPAHV